MMLRMKGHLPRLALVAAFVALYLGGAPLLLSTASARQAVGSF